MIWQVMVALLHSKRAAEDSNGPVSFTAYEMNGDLDRKAQCVRISISYLTLVGGGGGRALKTKISQRRLDSTLRKLEWCVWQMAQKFDDMCI